VKAGAPWFAPGFALGWMARHAVDFWITTEDIPAESGAVRGLLGSTRLPPKAATAAHLAAVWGQEIVMLPTLDVAPPINLWGKDEIAIDVFHHVVYATATGIAYEALSSNGR
jgi:hypothetical protein